MFLNKEAKMKKGILLVLIGLLFMSCSYYATPTYVEVQNEGVLYHYTNAEILIYTTKADNSLMIWVTGRYTPPMQIAGIQVSQNIKYMGKIFTKILIKNTGSNYHALYINTSTNQGE